jgi:hypothetical protein
MKRKQSKAIGEAGVAVEGGGGGETGEVQEAVIRPLTKETAVAMKGAELIEYWGTKSAAIRGLHALGFTASEIAKMLGVIYQHARNVILRPMKRQIKHERELLAKRTEQ